MSYLTPNSQVGGPWPFYEGLTKNCTVSKLVTNASKLDSNNNLLLYGTGTEGEVVKLLFAKPLDKYEFIEIDVIAMQEIGLGFVLQVNSDATSSGLSGQQSAIVLVPVTTQLRTYRIAYTGRIECFIFTQLTIGDPIVVKSIRIFHRPATLGLVHAPNASGGEGSLEANESKVVLAGFDYNETTKTWEGTIPSAGSPSGSIRFSMDGITYKYALFVIRQKQGGATALLSWTIEDEEGISPQKGYLGSVIAVWVQEPYQIIPISANNAADDDADIEIQLFFFVGAVGNAFGVVNGLTFGEPSLNSIPLLS